MDKFLNFVTISYFILGNVTSMSLFNETGLIPQYIPDSMDLIKQYGKDCKAFDVITEDEYILKVFRILGNASRPVLLMHGLLDSSDGYIERGENSIAMTLANEGYDVWLGNTRGNRYSRRHLRYNPDIDKEFWDYSLHEMGYYDLPAIIDFILDKTEQQSLSAIGHSEGTTIFYVLGSTKPKYNQNVKVIGSLAPIAYIENMKGLIRLVLEITPILLDFVKSIQYEEIVGFDSYETALIRKLCSIPNIGYDICVNIFVFPTVGFDPDNFEPEFLPTIVSHFPSGTSRKNLEHLSQIGLQKRFAQFDFGVTKNMEKYNHTMPPEYELNKVTMDVAMYLGRNDFLSTIEDVEHLKNQLPNVVEYQVIKYDQWNHFDHLYGRDMAKHLFPLLLDLLKKYN